MDVLQREDGTKLEMKVIKELEKYMFDMIKELPMLKLETTRTLAMEDYNES